MKVEDVQVFDDPDGGRAHDVPALPELVEGKHDRKAVILPVDFPENAKPSDEGDGSYLLTLDYPKTLKFVAAGGATKEERYDVLHLHRLTGKAQREISQASNTDFRPQMIASSTGMSLGRARLLHDVMDASDIAAVLAVIKFFTTPGRKTGA
jgi:hypothetical protein